MAVTGIRLWNSQVEDVGFYSETAIGVDVIARGRVEGCEFWNQTTAVKVDGGATGVSIIGNRFESGTDHVVLDNCANVEIADNIMFNALNNDISVVGSGAFAVTITDNIFDAPGPYFIEVDPAATFNDVLIDGNIFYNGSGTGTMLLYSNSGNSPSRIVVSNNWIDQYDFGKGIVAHSVTELIIRDNFISRPGGGLANHGIVLDSCDKAVIAGNDLSARNGTNFDGIQLYGTATNTKIVDNTFRMIRGGIVGFRYGVNISAATITGTVIAGNHFENIGTAPIFDTGVGTQVGPAAEEWNLALPASRTDQDVLTWDSASSRWILTVHGGPGTDTTAIHDDTAGEISAVTEKTAPVAADLVIVEDSAATNAKKRVQVGNLPSPLTTKGDLFGFDTAKARVPVGTDGDVLTADSTQSLGVKWAVPGKFGSDTIADTASTVVVTHGLGTTPTSVVVTPAANEPLWVTSIGATTFTINRAGTTGALTVYWRADG